MEIKILDPQVIDQIAAGEVVERPSHLVKELIENSLDAGATKVEVEVDQGGKKVKIIDNGKGIYKGDLPLVCARHATSKISELDDLWKLSTYGFRGEALASIASVSRLKITSRRRGESTAYSYINNFGTSSEAMISGGDEGTTIEIDELFANVPARLKFLKSDSAEVVQIKNVVKAQALSYPQVDFKLRVKNEVVFFYKKTDSLLKRAQDIFDSNDLFTTSNDYQGYKVEVVYSSPNTTAKVNKNLWCFVQNRWVQDRTMMAAVMEAYRNLLMHGEYPYALIKVQVPPEDVDVNIHPTKSQVKFKDNSFIFKIVQSTLCASLETAPWIEKMGVAERQANSESFRLEIGPEPMNTSFASQEFERVQYAKRHIPTEQSEFPKISDLRALAQARETAPVGAMSLSETPSTMGSWSESTPVETRESFWSRLQVLGQAHLTYILAEGSQALYMVDQHAAHERVLFEKLMEQWKNKQFEIQNYLLPLSIEMEPDQLELIMALKNDFSDLGLEIEQGGPQTLLVTAALNFITEKAISKSLLKMAEDLRLKGGSFSFQAQVGDLFATMACHTAVRAGQPMSREQMVSLLEQMDDFALSSYCPHGRNVYVEMSYGSIEKNFGRKL
ncbi:MAG: DNA mismatch repair endonuclease MutL [Bdellovibrionales bacterium]|nr:DNA mismatch repair endonuclease MutL [Bdellovibrionales bacterium]